MAADQTKYCSLTVIALLANIHISVSYWIPPLLIIKTIRCTRVHTLLFRLYDLSSSCRLAPSVNTHHFISHTSSNPNFIILSYNMTIPSSSLSYLFLSSLLGCLGSPERSLRLSETIKVGLFVSYVCSLSRNNWENNAIPSNTRNQDLANFICYLHLFWLCWSLFIEDYAVLSWFWPTCFCSGLSIALARNYNSIMLQLMSDKLSRIGLCILLL